MLNIWGGMKEGNVYHRGRHERGEMLNIGGGM